MNIELQDNDNAHLEDSAQLIARVDQLGESIKKSVKVWAGVIFGQTDVVEETLITIFAGGHMLLIGVPGLGKTRLVETLGTVLGLDDKRVQFTPDLMPADILGSEVLEETESGRRSFRFIQGPVFCQLLMADEINRASPRTQSALLQPCKRIKSLLLANTMNCRDPFMFLQPRIP